MLLPQRQDDEVGKRKYGAIQGKYYNMSGFRYGNIHIGILAVLYVTGPGAPGMPVDGPMDAVLAYAGTAPTGTISIRNGPRLFLAAKPVASTAAWSWVWPTNH